MRSVIAKLPSGLLIVPLRHVYIVTILIVRLFIMKMSGAKVIHGLLQFCHGLLILLKVDNEVCSSLPLEDPAPEIFNILSLRLLLID